MITDEMVETVCRAEWDYLEAASEVRVDSWEQSWRGSVRAGLEALFASSPEPCWEQSHQVLREDNLRLKALLEQREEPRFG